MTPAKPVIANAVLKIGRRRPAADTPVALEGSLVLTPEHDALLVRMQGQFLSTLRSPTQRIFVLQVGETVFDAALELEEPTAAVPLERIRPGSVVAVTGVYSYQWGPPPSFRLFLRSPADVILLSAAPWWTLRHTAVMIGMLALVAGGRRRVGPRRSASGSASEYQAVLNERSRVGRELHDTLEQGLAGIALQLEAVAGSLRHVAGHRAPVARRRAADAALQPGRGAALGDGSPLAGAREPRSRGRADRFARQMTLGDARARRRPCRRHASQRLDAAQEHHLLRIGLEALTNALSHADATRIDIVCASRPDGHRAHGAGRRVRPGPGAHDMPGQHFGLQGIRERVDKLGAC